MNTNIHTTITTAAAAVKPQRNTLETPGPYFMGIYGSVFITGNPDPLDTDLIINRLNESLADEAMLHEVIAGLEQERNALREIAANAVLKLAEFQMGK